ncbi:MAG: DUF2793 domain-containing protein [Alphaproteobacteria bacterium]|nr:DUF2793 domain-containing protein [Alphaproteobacteria bacterium]NNF23352.1 DUF2793 domain-containing protein [Paracoccaceae bacterium]
MSNTNRLSLPLVQPSQAQKHVTVNEALLKLDAFAQLAIRSRGVTVPPVAPAEGDLYAVGAAPVNDWAGQAGMVALFSGGGWQFVPPQTGWRGWIQDEGVPAIWDGTDWLVGAATLSPNGSAFVHRSIETDHTVLAGAASTTGTLIPANTLVYGVAGLVLSDLGGTATAWQLGVDGVSANRYGSGLGVATGSYAKGLTSTPIAYYSDTALTLTADGGGFGGGVVRLVVHLAELTLPRP